MQEKCSQTSCSHHPDNDLIPKGRDKDLLCAMCPVCNCGCQPHIVETECDECNACQNVAGFIRGQKYMAKEPEIKEIIVGKVF